jgi:hypothetical protein
MKNISESELLANGYQKQTFFYQIGGSEDENDMAIFVKDGFAISFDWTVSRWRKVKYSDLNYINGWPEQNQEWI